MQKLQRRRCSARDWQGWCRQHGNRSRCTRGAALQRPKPTQLLLLTLGDPISPRTCATSMYRLGVARAPMQRCAPPRSTIRPARCIAHARRSAHARPRPSRGASHQRVAPLATCAIHARNVRRETPGQTLGGTFGTHSVSQAAAVSPAGVSSNSRVRMCKLARSMAFRMFSLQVDTCRRRLYSGVRPSAATSRAFVSAAEWWGRRGSGVA